MWLLLKVRKTVRGTSNPLWFFTELNRFFSVARGRNSQDWSRPMLSNTVATQSLMCLLFKLKYNSHTIKFTLLKCVRQRAFIYSQGCTAMPLFISKTFSSSHKKPIPTSLPQPLATANLLSVSMGLLLLTFHTNRITM